MGIVNECMLVSLSIGVWTGHKLDKDASERITAEAGADMDAARLNKHLIPKQMVSPLTAKAQVVRRHFYNNTLPWRDEGDRLLSRKLFTKFMQDHAKLAREFKDAVNHFIEKDYPRAMDQASFRMGELFNRSDYPPQESLHRRFHVDIDIHPVATAGDFRVELAENDANAIRAQMEEKLQDRVQKAEKAVWDRAAQAVGHFAKKMSSGEKFKATTVTNVAELVELLPGLNFTDDPDLEAIRQRIMTELVPFSAEDLRRDDDVRELVGKEAEKIMADMKGFMSAFGNADDEETDDDA